jgi:hypothetical protein
MPQLIENKSAFLANPRADGTAEKLSTGAP